MQHEINSLRFHFLTKGTKRMAHCRHVHCRTDLPVGSEPHCSSGCLQFVFQTHSTLCNTVPNAFHKGLHLIYLKMCAQSCPSVRDTPLNTSGCYMGERLCLMYTSVSDSYCSKCTFSIGRHPCVNHCGCVVLCDRIACGCDRWWVRLCGGVAARGGRGGRVRLPIAPVST